MKRIAEEWKTLNEDEKKHWEEEAAKDKERYQQELLNYPGPLKVINH